MEKAKYGKMRQVNAVNGSQMVVKIGVAYYRRKQEHKVTSQKLSSLLYTITTDFSTIKKRHSAAAECLAGSQTFAHDLFLVVSSLPLKLPHLSGQK